MLVFQGFTAWKYNVEEFTGAWLKNEYRAVFMCILFVFRLPRVVGGGGLFDNPARIPGCHNSGRNAVRNHAAGSYNGSSAYGNARENAHMPANPNVVAYCNGLGGFVTSNAGRHIQGVVCGVDSDLRTNQDIVSDIHGCCVENHETRVCKKVVANVYVVAQVAVERRDYGAFLTHTSEKRVHNRAAFFAARRRQRIEFEHQFSRTDIFCPQFLAAERLVEFAGIAQFFFGHGVEGYFAVLSCVLMP